MDKKITFKAKKDIYWKDWEHLRLVFSRGNVYPGTLHKDGCVTAETLYYEGVSDLYRFCRNNLNQSVILHKKIGVLDQSTPWH